MDLLGNMPDLDEKQISMNDEELRIHEGYMKEALKEAIVALENVRCPRRRHFSTYVSIHQSV